MQHTMIKVSLASAAIIAISSLVLLGRQADGVRIGPRDFHRHEVQLNTFTGSAQAGMALDMARDGSLIAAWDSRRQDSGTYGVFARWVDPHGRPKGPEEQVNVEKRSMQMKPSVAAGDGDAALFAWQSYQQDGEAGGIISRAEGDERVVNERVAGDQSEVAIDRLAGGRTIAAWKTIAGDPTHTRIAVRMLTSGGAPLGEEIPLDAPAGARDRLPCVAADGIGGAVVAWARESGNDGFTGVLAQRLDADLNPVGPPIEVSLPGASAIEPSVGVDASGNFAVAWHEYNKATEYDVMLRMYTSDGAARMAATPVASDQGGWQSGAAVAMASGGRCLVAWNHTSDGGTESDVRARVFDAAGAPETPVFAVNAHTKGLQALTAATGVRRVVLGDDGRMAFAWQGDSGHGDDWAANLTMLLPKEPGLAGDIRNGLRQAGDLLVSLSPGRARHLDLSAVPHVPPTYDESARGPLLDSDHLVVEDRRVGFTGFTNTGWTPPDPHMAAGPAHVMGIVNGGIVVYQKNGTLVWQDDISNTGGFWGEVGATSFVFDPEVIFDPYENRFIAMANERSTDNRSMFLLAISHTADPSNQENWYKYRFDVTALGGNDIDSPNLAVDREVIYLTADFFTGGQKYLVYTIDKSSVINGGAAVTRSVLRTGSQSFGIPVMYTDDAPRMYMIEHFETDPASTIRLWAINDPLGSPALTSFTLSVPTYYRPANLRSLGTTVQPIAFDSRFWSCMYRDGSLWAAHHISLSSSPRITTSRWYEIQMNGWPTSGSNPTLRQSGTVAPQDQVYCSFNSIFADADGNAVMLFARSSVNEYFSIARTYRLAGDPLGFMSPPEFVKQSSAAYGEDRWGDYSAVVGDPAEPGVFWMHHEYTPGAGSWHTWIGSELISTPDSYLSLEGTRISDDESGPSSGNGDGDLNPAETIELWVNLQNLGQQSATHVSGVLSLDGDQATILDADAAWNNIPPSGQGENLTPFVFTISGSVADGATIPFVLTVTDDFGAREISVPLIIVAPVLAYESHINDDALHGNGNGIPEPGEVLALHVVLSNTGGQTAESIEAILSSSSPNVVIIDETAGSPGIGHGGQDLLTPPYRIAILSGAAEGDVLNFDLAITTESGYATESGFTIRVGSFFFDDVEAEGSWSLSSIDDDAASGQWVRVDPNGTFQTGQIPAQTEDDHTPDPGTDCFVTGQGSVGGAVGEADVDGGKTTLTTPMLDLTGVAAPIVSYWCWYTNNLGNNPDQDVWLVQISSDGGVAWVDLENTTASHNTWEERSFLVGDYVTPTAQVVLRFVASDEGGGSLVEAAVDDLSITGEGGVVAVGDLTGRVALRLDPVRPNPVAGSTTFTFALPGASPARLRIVRADGGLVRTLLDEVRPAGIHHVTWDGRGSEGQAVSSGVYFVQLTAGDKILTRRLVMLRS